MTSLLNGKYGNYILIGWIIISIAILNYYNLLTIELLLKPILNPYSLIEGSFIFAGLYLDIKLFKMLIYEIKKKDDGEKYLKYGKKLSP